METTETLNLVCRVLLKLIGPKLWGLHPEKGWKRPSVIDYNGEWYILTKEYADEYLPDDYYDYTKDIECGIYVPTGVKVGEE